MQKKGKNYRDARKEENEVIKEGLKNYVLKQLIN